MRVVVFIVYLVFLCSTFSYADEAKRVLSAYKRAYYTVVDEVKYKDGDWAISVRGDWFYWSHGRILPLEKRENYASYKSYIYYTYRRSLDTEGPVPSKDLSTLSRYGKVYKKPSSKAKSQHGGFTNALYGASTKEELEANLIYVKFLGIEVRVNKMLQLPLKMVENDIRSAARTDDGVKKFVQEIDNIWGYSWRNIAHSGMKSYHSYGFAIDITPAEMDKRNVYWMWTLEKGGEEWYKAPYEDRWMVPKKVVDAFERYGFIWGGKWRLYDNMHFEYRPELILLSR